MSPNSEGRILRQRLSVLHLAQAPKSISEAWRPRRVGRNRLREY